MAQSLDKWVGACSDIHHILSDNSILRTINNSVETEMTGHLIPAKRHRPLFYLLQKKREMRWLGWKIRSHKIFVFFWRNSKSRRHGVEGEEAE
jgi:hypothetical protein